MKKLICMLLLTAVMLSICGCGGNGGTQTATEPEFVLSEPDGTFQVGYGQTDITPEKSVPLGGFGNTSMRMSTAVLRRLYTTSIAMRDAGGNTVLLISVDLQCIWGKFATLADAVSLATGVPRENVIVCASHTHAGPDGASNEPNLVEYAEEIVIPQSCAAAVASLQDLKTARMSIGSVETEKLNFIKHYQYTDAQGNVQFFGDNFGTAVYDETTIHATAIDETMFVLQITREGEKDIVLTNWRAHPLMDGASSKTDLSADFIGAVRESVELQRDCHFVFYQGAAGNNNSTTRLSEERRTTDTAEYGALLAGYVLDCLQSNMTPIEGGPIQVRQTQLEAEINHTTDSMYYDAKAVQAVWTSTNNYAQAVSAGGTSGIRSPYQANAIINRYNKEKTQTSELNAIAIGDSLAFVSAPNELYDTLSVMTEEGSPYPWTLTLGFSNGYTGYIPSAYGWEYTSYESDVSWFVPGTGEVMVDCFLSMLKEMKG